jgi:hypothetical protein
MISPSKASFGDDEGMMVTEQLMNLPEQQEMTIS